MWWRFILFLAIIIVNFHLAQGDGRHRRNTNEQCNIKYRRFPGHTACLDKSPDAVSFALTNQEKQQIVDQHNNLRRGVQPSPTDMLKMIITAHRARMCPSSYLSSPEGQSWDEEVAMIARKWTDSCQVVQGVLIVHDQGHHRFIPGRFTLGQNLASGHQSFSDAIDAWYAETTDYVYDRPFLSFTNVTVGHYTQLVWAESYKIGCSRTRCSNRMIYACNYAPGGNVIPFNGPYNTGMMSQCNQTDNGLCDCGNLECTNNVPLDVTTCSCDCQPQYFVDASCNLNCSFPDEAFCGTNSFPKESCYGNLALSVIQQCPTMCEVCPYALPGYVEDDNGDDNSASTTYLSTFLLMAVVLRLV